MSAPDIQRPDQAPTVTANGAVLGSSQGAAATAVPEPRLADSPIRQATAIATDDVSTRTVASRLLGVDATRGAALVGMVAVHSLLASDPFGNPTLTTTVAAGRAAAAFAVLAGVGLAFTTGRARARFDGTGWALVRAVAVRALAIGAIGFMLGGTDSAYGAMILPYYAVLFLLAIPLLFLPTWALFASGLVLAAGMPVVSHLWRAGLLGPGLPPPLGANPSWEHLFGEPVRLAWDLLLTGSYPALPWTAYIAFGLAIGRLRLRSVRVGLALLVSGLVLAGAAFWGSWYLLNERGGLQEIDASTVPTDLSPRDVREIMALGADGTTPTETWWWLAINAPHSSTPFTLLHTAGSAIAVLGLFLLLARIAQPVLRGILAVVLVPLAAVGAIPLTLYTAHVAFVNSELDTFDPNTGFVVQLVAGVLIALAWRATAGRGPLEALVSWLSHRAGGRRLRTADEAQR